MRLLIIDDCLIYLIIIKTEIVFDFIMTGIFYFITKEKFFKFFFQRINIYLVLEGSVVDAVDRVLLVLEADQDRGLQPTQLTTDTVGLKDRVMSRKRINK